MRVVSAAHPPLRFVAKCAEIELPPHAARVSDRAMNADVAELADPAVLRRLLAQRAAPARAGRIAVAFACGARVATARSGDAPLTASSPLGCLAKLFTATLVRQATHDGRFALDDSVATLLGAAPGPLRGVSVRHLLEHTHGLDDSLLPAPRYERGFIDRAELLQRVGALERFAGEGAVYSYGHVGAWLAAAILERLHGCAFTALARDRLLEPLAIDGVWSTSGAVPLCPATGAGLALTPAELVRFGLQALTQEGSLAAEPIAPLPGWHPLERGVCLGWKYAGAGWFGHQSAWPGASSYLRVQPERRLALAVVSSAQAAALVAVRVFGLSLPELFESMAQLRSAGHTSDLPGTYEQAARVIAIATTPSGLLAETWERDERGMRRGEPTCASLASTRGVLFAQPAREHLPFAEPVRALDGARWLWNGRCVLRQRP
jgi:CubicO group peptidase (beta-lactamase class C family)